MPLLLDSFYTIGRLHLFCQDYVCQGLHPVPYIILADGCSAAPDSDLGARLLVLNARALLSRFIAADTGDKTQQTARHWQLGRRIIRRATQQVRDLGLDEGVLDATLLMAWCDGRTVHAHLYGDGCIATRNADGTVAVIQVEYAGNAPYYLSYLLNAERRALYRAATDEVEGQSVRYLYEGGATERREPFDTPTLFSFNLATFPVVVVSTDGLHSFLNTDTGERLELLDVARQFLDFPVLSEDFVKRQTREVVTAYARQRIVNLDDLGWGAFIQTGFAPVT